MSQVSALPGTPRLKAAVEAAFADDGPLVRAVDHFEPRQGQRAMAAAVADTLDSGGILLAEAGTGTGKTLAYLVPAILNRQRVLISTGTKNLQEQIYFKDIPAVREALGVPFTATCMKGRANYLCLHRLDQLRAHPAAPMDFVSTIDEWRRSTETGDRAELADLPEDSSLWHDVSAIAETCLGQDCPQYRDCYVTKMRQQAAESDVVIVNHHLLCADASVRKSGYGEVIPDCHYAVIDEAHHLEDVATQYFGVAISNYRVADVVRDAERALNLAVIEDDDSELRHAITRVDDHSLTFFGALATARHARGGFEERLRIGPGWFGDVLDDGLGLIAALNNLDAIMKKRAGTDEAGAQPNEEAETLARRAAELRDQLTFLLEASNPSFVYFLETRNRGVFLRAAPIDVSGIIREMLFDRMRATIMTSATLAVDGRFDYVKNRLGVADADAIRVRSEFDFAEQAILYLPKQMPPPKSPEYASAVAREVIDLLQRTEGRAFVLFTSYSMLRQVRDLVARAIPYPIIVQGTAPRSALLAEFRTTPHAVLFATSSFWQGVDVVGEQ
ncbi:MAG TPA: ATP-dependent DNA helicase, partial [Vicinamibacterales bacterium]|nr:ATP-dependent DNA helicase [Vicinamibacterales bacterium]